MIVEPLISAEPGHGGLLPAPQLSTDPRASTTLRQAAGEVVDVEPVARRSLAVWAFVGGGAGGLIAIALLTFAQSGQLVHDVTPDVGQQQVHRPSLVPVAPAGDAVIVGEGPAATVAPPAAKGAAPDTRALKQPRRAAGSPRARASDAGMDATDGETSRSPDAETARAADAGHARAARPLVPRSTRPNRFPVRSGQPRGARSGRNASEAVGVGGLRRDERGGDATTPSGSPLLGSGPPGDAPSNRPPTDNVDPWAP